MPLRVSPSASRLRLACSMPGSRAPRTSLPARRRRPSGPVSAWCCRVAAREAPRTSACSRCSKNCACRLTALPARAWARSSARPMRRGPPPPRWKRRCAEFQPRCCSRKGRRARSNRSAASRTTTPYFSARRSASAAPSCCCPKASYQACSWNPCCAFSPRQKATASSTSCRSPFARLPRISSRASLWCSARASSPTSCAPACRCRARSRRRKSTVGCSLTAA